MRFTVRHYPKERKPWGVFDSRYNSLWPERTQDRARRYAEWRNRGVSHTGALTAIDNDADVVHVGAQVVIVTSAGLIPAEVILLVRESDPESVIPHATRVRVMVRVTRGRAGWRKGDIHQDHGMVAPSTVAPRNAVRMVKGKPVVTAFIFDA